MGPVNMMIHATSEHTPCMKLDVQGTPQYAGSYQIPDADSAFPATRNIKDNCLSETCVTGIDLDWNFDWGCHIMHANAQSSATISPHRPQLDRP